MINIQGAINGGDNLGLKGMALQDCDSFGHTLPSGLTFVSANAGAGSGGGLVPEGGGLRLEDRRRASGWSAMC